MESMMEHVARSLGKDEVAVRQANLYVNGQVCAYELNIPMDKIRVKKASTVNNANSTTSGGSITSELACLGVIEACAILKKRMAPVKETMHDPTWEQLVTKCFQQEIDMTASY
ncbi:aldehyde oxidase, partial [Elysia marginata]